jgi:hypothetical protein
MATGRAWLDVLQTITTPWEFGDPFHFVIYQRYEVTGIVRNSKARAESIDFDGDGAEDMAVYRPGTGMWYSLPSGSPGTYKETQWGTPADVPVPADYDGDGRTDTAVWRPGDGKTDIAIWRPSNGIWCILPAGSPGTFTTVQWGIDVDVPVSPLSGILRSIP